jgi:hypothetical protein
MVIDTHLDREFFLGVSQLTNTKVAHGSGSPHFVRETSAHA